MGNDLNSIGTLIQARVNSSRLPNKVFLPLAGRPILGRVLDQHRSMRLAGIIVVVTSETAADDAIESFCRSEGVLCFRGSEEDVLDRYFHAAQHYKLQIIIRGTGDNPLVDPYLGDALVQDFIDKKVDYATSKSVDVDSGLPDGVGLEVFSFNALEAAHYCGLEDHHREHINEYILENPERFSISVFKPAFPGLVNTDIRLTVDTPGDLSRIQAIYDHFANSRKEMDLAKVVEYCRREAL